MTQEKKAQISVALIRRVNNGMTVREAMDDMMGAGTFDKLAGEVYDALRTK